MTTVSGDGVWGSQAVQSIRDLKKFLMYLFEGINALLELDIVRWELGLDNVSAAPTTVKGLKLEESGWNVPCHQQCPAAP